ncbi:MAG: ROK family transcriptional regulator [Methyloligellaceae bacterium]
MSAGSPANLRRQNRDLVLKQIIENRALSRTEIAQQTGLTGAAVSRITRELIDVGLLREGPTIELKGRVGRRNVRLELDASGAYVLGVALTANVRSVCVSDCRGDIVGRADVAALNLSEPEKALEAVARTARDLIRETRIDASRLLGCGVSVAGRADPETGVLVRSDPLAWRDVPIGEILSDALSLPVRVEGRAVALLLAELRRGVAVGKENVLLVNNGLGIGGSVVLDGRLVRGRANAVGQIAHMPIRGETVPCVCGRWGCLDAVASGASVLRRLADVELPEAVADGDPGEHLRVLAELSGPGHWAVQEAFREAGRKMAYAIDTAIAILDPELVLLAGLAGRQEDYLAGLRETLGQLRWSEGGPPVLASEVTSDQSAVWLGLDAFVYSRDLDIDQLRAA